MPYCTDIYLMHFSLRNLLEVIRRGGVFFFFWQHFIVSVLDCAVLNNTLNYDQVELHKNIQECHINLRYTQLCDT